MGEVPLLERPVLVQALDGFVDAGASRRLAREHLLDTLESEVLVTFDVDQLIDYRSRRPEMTFAEDHWAGYAAPELVIRVVRDLDGVGFLLLDGPEPDYQWERFIAAVGLVIEDLDVRLMIGLNAIPMAVPHTRPPTVVAHGAPPELVSDYTKWLPTVQVPGGVGNLLEYRLGATGVPSCGFAVAVPYYMANLEHPEASRTLLTCVAAKGELSLPTDALEHAAEVVKVNVDKQVEASEEISAVVRRLEAQYDDTEVGRGSMLAGGGRLPTADELGAEFEQYLSRRAETDDPPA